MLIAVRAPTKLTRTSVQRGDVSQRDSVRGWGGITELAYMEEVELPKVFFCMQKSDSQN